MTVVAAVDAPRAVRRGNGVVGVSQGEAAEPFDLRRAWDLHGAEVLGFATTSLGDRAAAEDCVQETFVRAWRARARYAPTRGSVRTWIFAIARNVVRDAHRARGRGPTPVETEMLARVLPVEAEGQERAVDRIDLLAALARLSEEHREVVLAVAWQGEGYAEVAARTGVPVGTLRSRMYYALRQLRAHLDDDGGGGTKHG